MEFVHQGNQLFVEENYKQACEQYTKAIIKLMGKEQFPALFGRARASMYLDKHNNAIRDFGDCISLYHKHQLLNYYLGICLMKVGKNDIEKIKQAHKYLLIAQNGSSKQNRFEKAVEKVIKLLQKLQPKVEIKSENNNNNNNNNDIEMKTNGKIEKQSEEIEKQTEEIERPKIRESWYQTASNITFILYAKNLTSSDVIINFDIKLVKISLKLKNGVIFTRNVQLRHEIKPSLCKYTMNKYKIILTLIKDVDKNTIIGDWDELEDIIDDGKKHSNDSMIKSPWTTKRNWSKVDEYATKELEKEKPDGDEALQSLFSKIYGDADDDQKRAMIKSFQTSGGTVLSTNWGDVKDKDYEGKDKVLPTGQKPAKWEF